MIAFLSKPSQHAVHALAELTIRTQDAAPDHGPEADHVAMDRLIEHTSSPPESVAKIFSHLAGAGLVRSIIGHGGGYALARPAHLIPLLDIVNAVEGGCDLDDCVVGQAKWDRGATG